MTDSQHSYEQWQALSRHADALLVERDNLRHEVTNVQEQLGHLLRHAANLEHELELSIDAVQRAEHERRRALERTDELQRVCGEYQQKLSLVEAEVLRMRRSWQWKLRWWRSG